MAETTTAVLADRQDWKQLDPVPTLEDVLKEKPGIVVVSNLGLLTGDQRRLYVEGFVVAEVDAAGAIVRAYAQTPMAVPEVPPEPEPEPEPVPEPVPQE
jgi:hypothetical protein